MISIQPSAVSGLLLADSPLVALAL